MNVLNLDDLAKESRTITLNGETYGVIDMTVEGFIESNNQSKKLGENPTENEVMEFHIGAISRAVPDLSIEVLRKLSILKITTIMKFLNGAMDDKAEEPAAPSTKGAKKGKA